MIKINFRLFKNFHFSLNTLKYEVRVYASSYAIIANLKNRSRGGSNKEGGGENNSYKYEK